MIAQRICRGSQVRRLIQCRFLNTLLIPGVYVGHFEDDISPTLHDDSEGHATVNEDGGKFDYTISMHERILYLCSMSLGTVGRLVQIIIFVAGIVAGHFFVASL